MNLSKALVFFFTVFIASGIHAAISSSSNYDLNQFVIASDGNSSSTNYVLSNSVAGETAVGSASSASYSLESGFFGVTGKPPLVLPPPTGSNPACSEVGFYCSSVQSCPGTWVSASDSSFCCNVPCTSGGTGGGGGGSIATKELGQFCTTDSQCKSNLCINASCSECTLDLDCAGTEYCSEEGLCLGVQEGQCGEISNHKFLEYECCSNSSCSEKEFCNSSTNSCEETLLPKIFIQLVPKQPVSEKVFQVRVLRGSGAIVENVDIFIDGKKYNSPKGTLEFTLGRGKYLFEASKEGFASDSLLVEVKDSLNILAPGFVSPGQLVPVQVLDPLGNPVAGAEILVILPDGNTKTIKTNENGIAYVEANIAGLLKIEASSSGYLTAETELRVGIPLTSNESVAIGISAVLSIMMSVFALHEIRKNRRK